MLLITFNFLLLASAIQVHSRNLISQTRSSYRTKNEAKSESVPKKVFDERNGEHWKELAQSLLMSKASAELNKGVAKNVILFLGDGMSITTLAAARTYLGNLYGYTGEEIKLSFEVFPFTGLAKTYCVDYNVADSACSGTAYLSGVKANSGTVGLSAAVKKGDCNAQNTGLYSVTGLMDWAQKAGKATGLVTTTRITHATPAAAYAHSADRKWEADSDVPNKYDCEDIATQLVRGVVGSKINVILGGGRRNFYPQSQGDPEGNQGYRSDGVNLVNEWLYGHRSRGLEAEYVYNRDGLEKLNGTRVTNVLGLFSSNHMPYHLEAGPSLPTLTDMTLKAIDVLKKEKNGFFLFVEGGRIDTAHHETKAWKALDETVELAKAVEAAVKSVNSEDTLIVVTSDHSHTMTYSGYGTRGSKILGVANKVNGSDGLPFTTLSYANGPGYKTVQGPEGRRNILGDNINDIDYEFPSLVPMSRETHGGEDVAVFAKGPWAHLFSGNYEQNYLPHAIAFASCIGEGITQCDATTQSKYSV